MKKFGILLFIMTTFCLLPICFGFGYQLKNEFHMELQDMEGDSAILDPIHLKMSYVIGNRLIDLQLIQGTFRYEFHTDEYADLYDEEYSSSEPSADVEYLIEGNKVILSDKGWQDMYEYCDINTKDIEEVSLRYVMELPGCELPIQIDTDLKDVFDGEHPWKLYTVTCDYGKLGTRRLEKPTTEDTSDGLYFETSSEKRASLKKKNEDTYYFMPSMGKKEEGQNEVYRIHVEETSYDVQQLIALPKDRQYETMELIHHELVVFSHDDDALYISLYQEDGSFIKEKKIAYQYQEGDAKTFMKVLPDTVIWQMDAQYRIIDLHTMEIIEEFRLDQRPYDIDYQDGVFYTLSEGSHQNRWYIEARKQGKRIYRGEIRLPNELEEIENSGVRNVGKFIHE